MSQITVIILTNNEATNIEKCVQSIDFAHEKIVFDCGSQDQTVAIAKRLGCQVYETDWPGESIQRNRALEKASHEWVLMLDADERISPALKEKILAILDAPIDSQPDVFEIAYHSYYLGKHIRYGDWSSERHARLFKRNKAHFSPELVHCRLLYSGRRAFLSECIIHHPYRDLNTVLEKINRYSTQSAETKFQQGKNGGLLCAISKSIWRFFYGYFFKAGFLDGREGFLLALSNAEGTFYRYMKLSYLKANPEGK